MKYSKNWLQEYIVEDLPTDGVIRDALNAKAFEVEGIEFIKYFESVKGDNGEVSQVEVSDSIFDIKVLPNRAHDALGHLGMAREIASCLDLNIKSESNNNNETEFTEINIMGDVGIVDVKVEDSKACTRFIAARVDNIKVGVSEEKIKNKLESIGQKSINNIVDITNYVQYAINKPMHAYDAQNIEGGIIVIYANENE